MERQMSSLHPTGDTDSSGVIQMEISKIFVLKAFVFASFGEEELSLELIQSYHVALQTCYSGLDSSMQLSSLLEEDTRLPRFLVYYLHMHYLGATTTIYQRIMHHFVNFRSPLTNDQRFLQLAYNIGKEGATSAKQMVRLVDLVTSEPFLVQKSWICLYVPPSNDPPPSRR
jgi:hypothetical protein